MWDVSDAYIVRTLINNQQKCPRMRMDLGWNWWFQQCFNLFSVFILDIYSVPFIHHTVPNRSSIPFLWLGDWYDVSLGEYCRDHIKTALFGGVLQLFWKILSDKRCSQRLFSSLRIRYSCLVVISIMIISFLSVTSIASTSLTLTHLIRNTASSLCLHGGYTENVDMTEKRIKIFHFYTSPCATESEK